MFKKKYSNAPTLVDETQKDKSRFVIFGFILLILSLLFFLFLKFILQLNYLASPTPLIRRITYNQKMKKCF